MYGFSLVYRKKIVITLAGIRPSPYHRKRHHQKRLEEKSHICEIHQISKIFICASSLDAVVMLVVPLKLKQTQATRNCIWS